jgi:mannose-1-phosphate guanylyltransferase
MLRIWLEICRRHGIDQVTINLHSHAPAVREFLDSLDTPVSVRIFEEEHLLGSAGTLRANREWIGNDSCFWVLYGDVLTTADLSHMMNLHRAQGPAATLGLYEVPNPKACGIATLDSNHVIREFVEKPASPEGNLAFSGLMIGTPDILDNIPAITPVDIGFHLLPRLTGRMVGHRIEEYLVDIGNLEAYGAAQAEWPGLLAKSDPAGKSPKETTLPGAGQTRRMRC